MVGCQPVKLSGRRWDGLLRAVLPPPSPAEARSSSAHTPARPLKVSLWQRVPFPVSDHRGVSISSCISVLLCLLLGNAVSVCA